MACVAQGGFQLFVAADMNMVAELPDYVGYNEASVIPICLSTAAVSLFHPGNLALPPPQLDAERNGNVVLVWGASSVAGSCAVQMIRAAGFNVAAVAGTHNSQYCEELGAKYVFDHKSDDLVEHICSALQGQTFAGVFTAIIDNDVTLKCASIAARLGQDESSRVVATVLPPNMLFTELLPEGVRLAYYAGPLDLVPSAKLDSIILGDIKKIPNDVAENVWGEWLTPALEKGIMKCMPEANVVGKRLESVQAGCDRLNATVSAMKIVVEMP